MLFGSEEMKEILLDIVQNPMHIYGAADIIQDCVIRHTAKRLDRGFEADELYKGSKALDASILDKQDGEEVINDVLKVVLTSLDDFTIAVIEHNYNELQRQAWLRRIIYNIIAKHIRQKVKELRVIDALTRQSEVSSAEHNSTADAETLVSLVRVVCKAPSKPEKIMAYIYNDFIFRELTARKKNASSVTTCRFMNGKKLFALKNVIPEALRYAFGISIKKSDMEPLIKTLGDHIPTEIGEKICSVTTKEITDWSHRMRTYVFMHSSEIF